MLNYDNVKQRRFENVEQQNLRFGTVKFNVNVRSERRNPTFENGKPRWFVNVEQQNLSITPRTTKALIALPPRLIYLREALGMLWSVLEAPHDTLLYADNQGVLPDVPEDLEPKYWVQHGQDTLKRLLETDVVDAPAKNVIVFVGDGMGVSTVSASRIYGGQLKGNRGEESSLSFERFPFTALVKTYAVDKQVTDSAASATALFCGAKTKYTMLGVSAMANISECDSLAGHEMDSFIKRAQDKGMSTGLVTTTRVTHATPAALYTHSVHRDWENDARVPKDAVHKCKDIARQLIEDVPGKNLNGGTCVTSVLGGTSGTPSPTRAFTRTAGRGMSVLSDAFSGRTLDSRARCALTRVEDHLTKGTAVGYVEEIQDSAAIAVISEDASPTQNKTITPQSSTSTHPSQPHNDDNFVTFSPSSAGLCAYVVLWMAFYYIVEPIPLPVTSLMPLVLFPLLGVLTTTETTNVYFNDFLQIKAS
ncbi:alkaline phosphatase, tissue-nonspecific isozyme-like [Ixodes scapularis]